MTSFGRRWRMANPALVRKWLLMVGAVTISPDASELDAKITALTPFLADDFADGAFCRRSAAAVAAACKHFPAYAEAREALNVWARDNPPQPSTAPQIAYDGPPPLAAMDSAWLAYWHRKLPLAMDREAKMGPAALARMDPPQRPRALLASLIQSQSPRAWREISGDVPRRGEPTDAERETVADQMAAWRATERAPAASGDRPAREGAGAGLEPAHLAALRASNAAVQTARRLAAEIEGKG